VNHRVRFPAPISKILLSLRTTIRNPKFSGFTPGFLNKPGMTGTLAVFLRWVLIILIALAQACASKTTEQPTNGLVYAVKETAGVTPRVDLEQIRCEGDTLGRINIELLLQNTTADTLALTASDFELTTEDGLRSAPVLPLAVRVPPESKQTVALVFKPVNSRRLFQLTGLHGDLGRTYTLAFPGGGPITFDLPDATYARYKNSRKEVRVFVLDYPENFETNQLAYLKDAEFKENGVAWHEEEVLVNGLNTAISAYTFNDTLVVKMKLVNHSLYPVRVELSQISLQHAKQMYFPLPLVPDSIVIPRSQRAFLALRYVVPDKVQAQFSLAMKSTAFLTPTPVPVFYSDTLALKQLTW
jgi:hypothetical protein